MHGHNTTVYLYLIFFTVHFPETTQTKYGMVIALSQTFQLIKDKKMLCQKKRLADQPFVQVAQN
eukprot:UN06130